MSSPCVKDVSKSLKRKRNDSTPAGRQTRLNARIIEISSEDEIETSSSISYYTADEFKPDKSDTPQARNAETGPLYPADDRFMKANDGETVRILRKRARAFPPNDERWFATDANGCNIMHIVASSVKPRALGFLKRIPPGKHLSSTRDLEGQTPLQHLWQKLDDARFAPEMGVTTAPADKFEGYSENEVACLALLTDTLTIHSTRMTTLRFGCTCGHCLGGFLSPRLVASLISAGRKYRNILEDHIDSGPDWCALHSRHLTNLHEPIRQNLRTDEKLRWAFVILYIYIEVAMVNHLMVPTSSLILRITEREWGRGTQKFIKRGGTVTAVALNFFDHAIDEDRYLGGNGDDESDSKVESLSLHGRRRPKKLRNAGTIASLSLRGVNTSAPRGCLSSIRIKTDPASDRCYHDCKTGAHPNQIVPSAFDRGDFHTARAISPLRPRHP